MKFTLAKLTTAGAGGYLTIDGFQNAAGDTVNHIANLATASNWQDLGFQLGKIVAGILVSYLSNYMIDKAKEHRAAKRAAKAKKS